MASCSPFGIGAVRLSMPFISAVLPLSLVFDNAKRFSWKASQTGI